MKIKKYIETDVLFEAKRRVSELYDMYDSVVVCTSFGKDSSVVLSLCRAEAERRGIKKVNAVFRDEELIPNAVIEHGEKIREYPWLNLIWLTVPLRSTKFILGKTYEYIQWDERRDWVREKPSWSVSLKDGDRRIFDQYTIDEFTTNFFKGSIVFVTGIRASESLMRLRSVMNARGDGWVTQIRKVKNAVMAKPIYDWEENDVFKYLNESGFGWSKHYEKQLWSGQQLRVSTPLHAEQSKRLYKLRETDPEFYDRILRIFPEVQDQDRYWRDYDQQALRKQYGESFEGVRSYIIEQIEEEDQREKALTMLANCETLHRKSPNSYPIYHILNHFMCGRYKRMPLPVITK